MRASDCAERTIRSNARTTCSGVAEDAKCLRDQLARAIDVLVRDVEVRQRAKHARMRRRREPDAVAREALERVRVVEPERTDVHLHEIRLDLLDLDRNARLVQPLPQPAR